MASVVCHHCGAALQIEEPIARDAECEACLGDVRACINCRHYDLKMNNACRETEADVVEHKTRRNFCEFFVFTIEAYVAGASDKGADAKAKLERMFRDPPGMPSKRAATPKQKLDGLFGGVPQKKDRAVEAREKLKGLFKETTPEAEAEEE